MKARLTTAAIYAARTHPEIRAALPAKRSDFCQEQCYARGDTSICDGVTSCWAQEVGARTGFPIACSPSRIYASRRLQLERGRTPAPRPRSLADGARTHYATQEGPR